MIECFLDDFILSRLFPSLSPTTILASSRNRKCVLGFDSEGSGRAELSRA